MTFTLLTYSISFLTANSSAQGAQTMISTAKTKVDAIISSVLNGTFDFAPFSLAKESTGLTNVAGLYLIVNKQTKKVYLGSSVNLAQRRREYKSYLNKNTAKVYKAMRDDLSVGWASDFYFVPIVGFHRSNVSGFTNTSQQAMIQRLKSFLDLEVEQPLLVGYLSSTSQHASLFYNEKTVGTFTQGNEYGGEPQSGSPNKPLSFENYAWESLSAAAKSLLKDRKSIRLQLKNGKFKEITFEEFNDFSGTKITNADAENFFQDKLQEMQTLKQKLGLR